MMKRERMKSKSTIGRCRLRVVSAAVFITVVMCACGSTRAGKVSLSAEAPAAAAEEYAYDTAAAYDGGVVLSSGAGADMVSNQYEAAEDLAEEPLAESSVQGGYEQQEAASVETGRKLIKTVNIFAETEDFDTLVPSLQKQVEVLGGYIESISVYEMRSYYVEDQKVKQRCANLTARVPKEKLDGFLAQVGEQTNVTSQSENVEDVTLQYVDLESHKKALVTEQERLLALLGKAETVEDIIAIEGRLSEVRYQLESMESQLRTYDNQIDYSTVYLEIQEVRQYTPPQTATAWQRIQSGFAKSLEDIGFGIRDFAIGFVIDIPYFVLWIVIIAVVVLIFRIVRKVWKERKAKKAAREEKEAQALLSKIRLHWPDKKMTAKNKPETGADEKQTAGDGNTAGGAGSGQEADGE